MCWIITSVLKVGRLKAVRSTAIMHYFILLCGKDSACCVPTVFFFLNNYDFLLHHNIHVFVAILKKAAQDRCKTIDGNKAAYYLKSVLCKKNIHKNFC